MARLALLCILLTLPAWGRAPMPYREAGLTEREAAAHLLSRFSYGARPGEVDEVVGMGLETWLEGQLQARGQELPVGPVWNLQELRDRRLRRAISSQNQLKEVMTDFWFNHFNVSARRVDVGLALADYEEKALRANALGLFEDLLIASAHHPAMLVYLDNESSRADPGAETALAAAGRDPLNYGPRDRFEAGPTAPMNYDTRLQRSGPAPKPIGINENYARELMELHTLGVDGGYRQEDVIEVARALTGWTVERSQAAWRFRYDDSMHDKRAKTVLKRHFPAGQGREEGERVLQLLARHGSTARHISHKLAVRFVSDNPSPKLVNRLQRRFLGTGGNVSLVLDELVRTPEFWRSRGEKVKTPLELTVSAVRALDGRVQQTDRLQAEMRAMGQALYEYDAPTGFPDRADFWINPGTLTSRINFGLQLAAGQVGGVIFELPERVDEPQSAREALEAQAARVLPGRDLKGLVDQLLPLVEDPKFEQRVQQEPLPPRSKLDQRRLLGILLGSPEFQRR